MLAQKRSIVNIQYFLRTCCPFCTLQRHAFINNEHCHCFRFYWCAAVCIVLTLLLLFFLTPLQRCYLRHYFFIISIYFPVTLHFSSSLCITFLLYTNFYAFYSISIDACPSHIYGIGLRAHNSCWWWIWRKFCAPRELRSRTIHIGRPCEEKYPPNEIRNQVRITSVCVC